MAGQVEGNALTTLAKADLDWLGTNATTTSKSGRASVCLQCCLDLLHRRDLLLGRRCSRSGCRGLVGHLALLFVLVDAVS